MVKEKNPQMTEYGEYEASHLCFSTKDMSHI